ncbi:hypothetical protein V5O48_008121 [Marasmius crinis-equi]|uniref:Uncharacterized protein n=1 Tax=Marasmius crinis-equi TaxID=585013 RepID=A0ABR3FEW4_9AGAR
MDFVEAQASAGKINRALDILQAQLIESSGDSEYCAPFENAKELYATIDQIEEENTQWTTYHLSFNGKLPENPPLWMTTTYEFCTRNALEVISTQLMTESFHNSFNYTPYRQWNTQNERMYSNLMSGDWAWKSATAISNDPRLKDVTKGAMLVPIVLGSDKTTVSVATGHQEYHPVYISPGNITNVTRRAHGNGVLPLSFLPIPHNHFPRADIHITIAPDLLHQLIKGTFMDHLVTWINHYLLLKHGTADGQRIIKDIDRRVSAVPQFPGIRRFHEGRDFNQWTGDDSKALMKVYLAALIGRAPNEMVRCLRHFLEMFYIARRNTITSGHLQRFQLHLQEFYDLRKAFIKGGVRESISLPRQHSLKHYIHSISLFGSPNGLDSSITESKHIKAVKNPWRRSSRYNALHQMLTTILRGDKMNALRRKLERNGLLIGTASAFAYNVQDPQFTLPTAVDIDDPDGDDGDGAGDLGPVSGPREATFADLAIRKAPGYPAEVEALSRHINQPRFPLALRRFLYDQLNPNSEIYGDTLTEDKCPEFKERISVFHSATIYNYAPSDECGPSGMIRERLRSCPHWQGRYPRRDTALVVLDDEIRGMGGMIIARILLFFSFVHNGLYYPCAFVDWFVRSGDEPDPDTGMWVVEPEYERVGVRNERKVAVIHLDTLAHAVHLLPVYGNDSVPESFHFAESLDAFRQFYVNKFANNRLYEFLSSD